MRNKKVGRYREGVKTRERILDTTLDLIASNGHSATSIVKISQISKTSKISQISTAAGVQLVSIERREGAPALLIAAQRVRKQAGCAMPQRVEQFIPAEDAAPRRAIAEEVTHLVMMGLDGVFVSRQVEPGALCERQLATMISRAVSASLNVMLTAVCPGAK